VLCYIRLSATCRVVRARRLPCRQQHLQMTAKLRQRQSSFASTPRSVSRSPPADPSLLLPLASCVTGHAIVSQIVTLVRQPDKLFAFDILVQAAVKLFFSVFGFVWHEGFALKMIFLHSAVLKVFFTLQSSLRCETLQAQYRTRAFAI